MSARKTLDIDFITLRKIRAVDPATNALITPNYILAMDTEGQAQWVNTLSNINTYGGLTGMTGPTGPINPAALLTVTGGPIPGLIGYIGQTIPHNVPTVVQLPNVDMSNSTTNVNIGILYDPVTGSFTNNTLVPLQLLLTWQIGWTNQTPITYTSLTTYAEVSGLYIDPLQSKYGYNSITDANDSTHNTIQSSSCVIYLDICDKFFIYARQTNSGNSSTLISGSTSDMALGYSTKLAITLVQTGPKGDTGPTGQTGPTGPVASLLTENFMVVGGGDGIAGPDMKFSYNGLQWNPCDLSALQFDGHTCNAIAWSGNLWAAGFTPPVGSGNPVYFAYSSDGINWYASPSSLTITSCNAIAWNGYMWTAGTSGSTVFAYSYDGIYWTSSPIPYVTTSQCNTIAWNGSIWVAGVLDSTTFQYMYSYDGINWLQSQTTTFDNGGQVKTLAYNGLLWVAGGYGPVLPSGSTLSSSPDGITWTSSSAITLLNNGCNSVAWNGYMWVAGGEPDSSGNTIVYSYDGQNWTDSSSGSALLSTGCNTVSWNGSIWFAGGNLCPDYAIYSNDGINWAIFDPLPFNGIIYASAARRPLPYVGKTIVPPVLNQYVGPPNGAITYVSPSGGTGLNDIYYSRFVTIHESGGTGTLEVMGTVQIGPTASITYDVSNDLVFNTNLLPSTGYAYNLGSLTYPWQGIYVGTGSVHIGPTGTISADPSNLVINTTLLPDISDVYTLGNADQFWKDVYVGTGGVHIGPTGSVLADQSNNLVVNMSFIPDLSDAYTLGNADQFWQDIYVGTGGVHIGPTGTIIADQSNNLVLNTTLLPDLSDVYTLGSTDYPWSQLFVGPSGIQIGPTGSIVADLSNNLIFSSNLIPDISNAYTLGSTDYPWSQLFVGQSGIQIGPTGTIVADLSNNLIFSSNLIPDMSGIRNIGSASKPWADIYLDTSATIHIGPTGTITSDASNNLVLNTNLLPATGNAYSLGSVTKPWADIWVGTGSVHIGPTGTISADQPGNVIISTTSGLSLTGPLGPSQVYDTVYNLPPGSGGGDFLTENFMVAVGSGTSPIIYSYDGTTWTNAIQSIFGTVNTVAWNGSLWVCGGFNSGLTAGIIAYSSDGINWYQGVGNVLSDVAGVAWNGSMWVAVGNSGVGGAYSTEYSYDGINWTAGQNIFSTGGGGIAWNGSIWIAVGQSSSSIYYSYNGISWQASSNDPFGGIANEIAWNDSLWVAVGQGSASIAWSSDGITWTAISNSTTLYFSAGYGIAWNGSQFVAVGGGIAVGRIAYSPDGKIWTAATSNPFSILGAGVTWNGYKWFAVGDTTPIMASSIDGNTWTTVSCGALNGFGGSIASRRVLPYVSQTVTPPIFHQNEIGPTGGALVFTSPTGTNNLYYSRFLNITENGNGTGVLKVNGTMDVSSVINPNGPLLLGPANKSDCLVLNTNPGSAAGYLSIGGAGAGTVNIVGGNPSLANYNGTIQMSGAQGNNPTLTIGANSIDYNNIIVGPGSITTFGTTNGLVITPNVNSGPLLSPTSGLAGQLLLGTTSTNCIFINQTDVGPQTNYGLALGSTANYWSSLYLRYPILYAPLANATAYSWTYQTNGGAYSSGGSVDNPEGTFVKWTSPGGSAPPVIGNYYITVGSPGIYRITLNFQFVIGVPPKGGTICIAAQTAVGDQTLAYSVGSSWYFSTITVDTVLAAGDNIYVPLGPGTYLNEVIYPQVSNLNLSLVTALF